MTDHRSALCRFECTRHCRHAMLLHKFPKACDVRLRERSAAGTRQVEESGAMSSREHSTQISGVDLENSLSDIEEAAG